MHTRDELIKAFYVDNGFQAGLIKEIRADKEKYVPVLLNILEYCIIELDFLDCDYEFIAHFYAMYLLAEFREQKALPIIVTLLQQDEEIIEELMGSFTSEDLSAVMASTCGGDLNKLYDIAMLTHINEYAGSAAVTAMYILYKEGIATREQVIEKYKTLFEELTPDHSNHTRNALINFSKYLYPTEVKELIVKRQLSNVLNLTLEECLAQIPSGPISFVNSTEKEFGCWDCFGEEAQKEIKEFFDEIEEISKACKKGDYLFDDEDED